MNISAFSKRENQVVTKLHAFAQKYCEALY